MGDVKRIAIIGAGAAGCFCAVEISRRCSAEVTVYESGPKALAKVALTGGGRCNLTNTFEGVEDLSKIYPRGHRLMNRLLRSFGPRETMKWFSDNAVRLMTQSDHRVFPASEDAMEIVRTLSRLMRENAVTLKLSDKVSLITKASSGGYILGMSDGSLSSADILVVTTGGFSRGGTSILKNLDIKIADPVPSLFAFEIQDNALRQCSGCSVENALVSISGTAFKADGALLVTDWGLSGPAILKLSAYAAKHLAESRYIAELGICWANAMFPGSANDDNIRTWLTETAASEPQKQVASTHPESLPSRIWELILNRAGLRQDIRWAEMGAKSLNRLTDRLLNDSYHISGKNKFKGEFVTCGGVALSEVKPQSLECKSHPGLYFAGEVLDIDGITGGFNLQAAWSTAHAVALGIVGSPANPWV